MQLSEHFTLDEFTTSQKATEKKIDNTKVTPEIIEHLRMLAITLEQVRSLLGGHPLHISSGYRCLALNRAIGSSDTSAHVRGYAADFTCSSFGTPKEIAKKLSESNIKFDQVINEITWVHISAVPGNRRDLRTAVFHKGSKTTYLPGLV
jgi:hypothetical protein